MNIEELEGAYSGGQTQVLLEELDERFRHETIRSDPLMEPMT